MLHEAGDVSPMHLRSDLALDMFLASLFDPSLVRSPAPQRTGLLYYYYHTFVITLS